MGIGEIENQGSWGWCLHCECAIRPEVFADIASSSDDDHYCPFDGCDGGGIGIDLMEIGIKDGMHPETWPVSPDVPEHGKIYPLYRPQ